MLDQLSRLLRILDLLYAAKIIAFICSPAKVALVATNLIVLVICRSLEEDAGL